MIGTKNEIQVSATTDPEFLNEKISEPIRIICPKRPQPPVIESTVVDKPFSIAIKWDMDKSHDDDGNDDDDDDDKISSYKIFLDGKLHGEIETDRRQSFKYNFNKLEPEATYSIYVKALICHKRYDGYNCRCEIESKASNELTLKCAAPPLGTMPRLERMYSNGIDIAWDEPVEHGDVKIMVCSFID